MTINAKEIIDGKFWIIENEGNKVATLAYSDEKYMVTDMNGSRFINDKKELEKDLGKLSWSSLERVFVLKLLQSNAIRIKVLLRLH